MGETWFRTITRRGLIAGVAALALMAPAAAADDWLPHPARAQWTYQWSDTTYNPNGTTESVSVDTQSKVVCGWQLKWSGDIQIPLGSGTGSGGSGAPPVIDSPDNGTMCFEDQNYGLVNTDWSGSSPPINEPPLCPAGAGQCPNSLASVLYDVIWGNRAPVISEPLLQGTSWNGTGGGDGSVSTTSQYLGLQQIKIPAFPLGVTAAVVRTQIALAGTPGDDYGSGTRTTWWVYGVGPAQVIFDHVDGSVTTAALKATNLRPLPARPDQNYFPLVTGFHGTYRWTNSKHLPQPEVEKVVVAAAVNRSARVTATSVSGPFRAVGNYVFSLRLDGLRNTYASTAANTLTALPHLGHGRHFFTPVDLMTYGFNPVLPAYPVTGTTLKSGNQRDFSIYGVHGVTTLVGMKTVRVPAGLFHALEVRSVLSQPGYRFGSGVRTMWFANGRGLVKLVFAHDDGSVSTIQLIR